MMDQTRPFYLLKRCGAPSTCEGVVDVFRLSKSRNIIGRNNTKVDFYLNSNINKCLISRHHAEIHVIRRIESNTVELLVKDSSLNGTYVNDVKIQGTVHLKAGDIVTFGHLTGASIKPGTHSPQLNSEFSFVVQEVTDSPSNQSVLSDSIHTFKEPSSPLNATIRAVNQLEASPLATQQAGLQASPVLDRNTTPPLQTTPTSRNTQASDRSGVKVEPQFDEVTNKGRVGMMVEVAGFAKLAQSPTLNGANTDVPNMSETRGQQSSNQAAQIHTSARGLKAHSPIGAKICLTPQRKVERTQTPSGTCNKPLMYILPKPSKSPTTPTTSRQLTGRPVSTLSNKTPNGTPQIPSNTIRGTSIIRGVVEQVNKGQRKASVHTPGADSGIYDDFRELDGEEEDMAVDSDGSDEDIFALASDIQAKVTNFIEDDDDNFSPHIPDSQNNNNYNDEDTNLSPIPGLDNVRNPSALDEYEYPGSPVFERCPSPVIKVVASLNTQGSQQKLGTRNGGKRVTVVKTTNVPSKKQKTNTAATKKVKGQIVYEALEVCSSIDCCKPLDRKETAAWVQCDDCDDWYHVDCVGCSYTKVKQSKAAFHCGCL